MFRLSNVKTTLFLLSKIKNQGDLDMPQHILDMLQQAKEDLELEERILTHEWWDECINYEL